MKAVVSLLVAAALLPACVASHRVSPAQYVPEHRPDRILVMDADGFIHLLDQPAIQGDSLVGVEVGTSDRLSFKVDEVTDAMVRAPSPKRTALLVGGLGALTAGGVVAILTMGSGSPCEQNPSGKGSESTGGVGQCRDDLPDGQ
jgi:hypothetical protein